MRAGKSCKECGTVLPGDSPAGFCARCLMGLALEPDLDSSAGSLDPDLETQSETTGTPDSASVIEKAGDRIGRYRLLQEIGQGGCGVVYMAEQEEPVRRRVALKVIKLGMDTRQVVARFEAERQALALMDHPNIAKALDAGATGTGRPFFVMELVGGVKITDYCDENSLSPRQRLELFIKVCRAVQHAHQKGIIHRDLKPSNVLVMVQDGVPVPKVIDFGIARATQGRLTDHTLFTAFEQFMGTPAYMSPEQAQPGGLDIDTRSDIYGLGVLLYELLTGKTPFEIKHSKDEGFESLRRTILEKEPLRPSTRLKAMAAPELNTAARQRRVEPLKLANLLRGDLDLIVMKCLEKDRGRRYETADALAMDIQYFLNQEPVVARPASALYRFQKFIRRNKLAAASTTAISTVLVLGITVSTWEAVKARRAEREQNRLRQQALQAKQDATDKLWASYLAEAKARRISGVAGLRFESLAAIRKAAAIKPSLALRNEAIAAMVLTDVRWVKEKDFSRRALVTSDAMFARYAVTAPGDTISIRRVSADTEVTHLPSAGVALAGIWIFSPDGKLLGALYKDNRLRIWDCDKSMVLLEAEGVKGADFAPDSMRLVTLENSNLVSYSLGQSAPGGAPIKRSFDEGFSHLLFHPAGRLLAAFSESQTNVLLVDSRSGEIVRSLPHPDNVVQIGWHPDGKHLATTCSDSMIHIWDTTTGQQIQTLPADHVVSVGFNHRGDLLVSAGWDGKMRLWDFANSRQLVSIYRAGFISHFRSDDQELLCSRWDGTGLDFFELAGGEGLRTIHEREKGVERSGSAVVFSNSGRLLAYATATGTRVWDVVAAREAGALDDQEVIPIGFDAEDKNLIVSGLRGLMRWPIRQSRSGAANTTGAAVPISTRIPGRVGRISADGKTCLLVGGDRCEIFKTDSFNDPVRTGDQLGMRFVALTGDGSLVASGAWHSSGVMVWDGLTGALIKKLPTEDEEASTVVFSPDNRRLIISTKRDYQFLDVGSWSTVLRIPQEAGNDFASMMCCSRDGTLFAGTHSRNVVRLFDAATGHVVADLESPDSKMVTGISFNADGTELAMCEGLGVVRVWDLRLIRERLASMGLDWDLPPYPPRSDRPESSSASTRIPSVEFH